uniref:DNA-repair protein Xrcc1 N-terminal domain-containing protein n=1 Tax=Anas platyrhynchos TaxID=8839 RepID=A0A8B9R019_ANAPL
MAPVRISSVVSFSSQDPRFPVENLLREDRGGPWLCCPRDRSRWLRAELQLEAAMAIGYLDLGNCGCALVQVEVGRSSWPRDHPYVPLVPGVPLMTPAESRAGENRCGVRMFKEADFLEPAVGQKWDRVRLTCSQPFSRQGQFGLSFLRLRTPSDPQPDPQPVLEGAHSPQRCSPAICRMLCAQTGSVSRQEEQLRSRLQQLEPGPKSRSPPARSPPHLSRPARMLLAAARSRAKNPQNGTTGSSRGLDPPAPALQAPRRTSPRPQKGSAGSGLAAPQAGNPAQDGDPQPVATARDPAQGARWGCAPSARDVSAWSCCLRTPPAAARTTPTPIPTPNWSIRPGCPAPSASSASALPRCSSTPAPAGSEGRGLGAPPPKKKNLVEKKIRAKKKNPKPLRLFGHSREAPAEHHGTVGIDVGSRRISAHFSPIPVVLLPGQLHPAPQGGEAAGAVPPPPGTPPSTA